MSLPSFLFADNTKYYDLHYYTVRLTINSDTAFQLVYVLPYDTDMMIESILYFSSSDQN